MDPAAPGRVTGAASWHRFAAELPNELCQADITHWSLADGREVEILDIIDGPFPAVGRVHRPHRVQSR